MWNIIKDKMPQTQQVISNPFKNTIENLKELDPEYNNGFTQRPHTININIILY